MWVIFRSNKMFRVGSYKPREPHSGNDLLFLFSVLGAIIATFLFPWIIAYTIALALFILLIVIFWRQLSFLLSKSIERDLNSGNMFDFMFHPYDGDILIIYSGENTHAFKFSKWKKWKSTTYSVGIPDTSNMILFAKGEINKTCDT
jgi:hypothetical protein